MKEKGWITMTGSKVCILFISLMMIGSCTQVKEKWINDFDVEKENQVGSLELVVYKMRPNYFDGKEVVREIIDGTFDSMLFLPNRTLSKYIDLFNGIDRGTYTLEEGESLPIETLFVFRQRNKRIISIGVCEKYGYVNINGLFYFSDIYGKMLEISKMFIEY